MKTPSRSRLLLLELMFDLLIFALCAVVCTALLVQAKAISRESTRLTEAVYIAQSAAERCRNGLALPAGYWADGTPVETADPAPDYTVTATETQDGTAVILSVFAQQEAAEDHVQPVYTLTVAGEVVP